jgi:outer membrane protein assembly factor BamE (lipoprotein component of BamABCDE complex)
MKSLLNTSQAYILLAIALLFLSGCQSVDVRGQYVDTESVDKINKQKLSQAEIIDLIGTPTYVPEYSENTWYYVQRSLTRRAWFEPKVVEQRIVKITFNKEGIASSAELLTDSQNENITVQSNYTKAYGTEKNGIQKFVGNIGRFNSTTDGKKKKQKRQ